MDGILQYVGKHTRGITNMFGAAPYLAEYAGIDGELAERVLMSWMENYAEIKANRGD